MERMKGLPILNCLGCLAFFLGACSPKTTPLGYEKYAYLIKDRHPAEDREVRPAAENTQDAPASWEKVSEVEAWTDPVPAQSPEVPAASPKNDALTRVLKTADNYLGVPYRYAGMSHKGMDCSGLVCKAYESVGIRLPRSSRAQAEIGKTVDFKRLQPGDLVFFSAKRSSQQITHVGIVSSVKGNQVEFIHASTSKGVRYDRLDEGYWRPLFQKGVSLRKKRADLGL